MLNKAREIMNQRESMIKEAQEVLVVLGAANESTVVTNETIININKGKIIEVPVVKEVAIENTNEEYIEQLLKDLDNRNKRIEELKAQLEREQQLYKDLEFEANEEIDAVAEKRDKEIARLKAENEKLKNDFIIVNNDLAQLEVSYELMKQDLSNKADKIDELELQLDELNRNYSALDSENEELDREIHVLMGQVAGYEAQLTNKDIKIESLEKQIADAKEDKVRAEIAKEKEVPKQIMRHKNVDITLYDVHKTHDGAVRGYTKDYEFAWNGKSNVPAYKTKGMKNWHPMIGDMYAEALYIKEQVKDMFKETKETKTTKEVTVNQTKEITIPTQKPNRTIHVTNGATISLPIVEAPEDEFDCGNTDDIDF